MAKNESTSNPNMTPPDSVRDMTADPEGLRMKAPLLDAYLRFMRDHTTPFTIPGHKQRTDLVGDVIRGDVPLYAGLDTMKVDHGTLAQAERLAGELWGADWARFSVGGSTHGNQALTLAIGQPGDTVIVGRTLHRSLMLGLVLADLRPVWVYPGIDAATGLPLGYSATDIDAALVDHPEVCAVFFGDPSYVGTFGDVPAIAETAHRYGVPLLIDAAWGAHYGFHPALPPHPIAAGADAMVTSIHKALPGYSAAALVLARTQRLDAARLEAGFEATHTTSPPGATLASIDAVRALMQVYGERLLGELLPLIAEARERLGEVDGVVVLDGPHVEATKLAISIAGTGADGVAIERDLIAAGMPVEYADLDTIAPMITIADTPDTVDRFVTALIAGIEQHRGTAREPHTALSWSVRPEQVTTPREAFFASHEQVNSSDAIGRISAEIIAPYPPGVPVLAPGERITSEILDGLREARAQGIRIAYAADPTLATMRVLT